MMSHQCFQALCVITLIRSCRMQMLSMILDEDDDDLLLLLYCHHQSTLHNNDFLFLLDSMFMNIEPEDVIPHLLPANLNRTFNLLDSRWCYHHTCFSVVQLRELYIVSTFQCPSQYLLEDTRLLLKKPSSLLLQNLQLEGPIQV
jgi:hypothetical protein